MNVMPGRKVKSFNKEVVINVSDVIHKLSKMNIEDYTHGYGGLR